MEEKGRWETWGSFGRSLSGAKGAKSPHELQPVREKLTESDAQPCSILCTANNFKISTSECIRYLPKCAFSSVSSEKFSGEGAQSPPQTPPPRRLRKLVPPTFWNKVTPLDFAPEKAKYPQS